MVDSFHFVQQLVNLEQLDISSCVLTGMHKREDWARARERESLEKESIRVVSSCTSIVVAVGHLLCLARLKRLRSLNLSQSRSVLDDMLKAVSHFSTLQTLDIVEYVTIYLPEALFALYLFCSSPSTLNVHIPVALSLSLLSLLLCVYISYLCGAYLELMCTHAFAPYIYMCLTYASYTIFCSCVRVTQRGVAYLQYTRHLTRLKVHASLQPNMDWYARLLPNCHVELYGAQGKRKSANVRPTLSI